MDQAEMLWRVIVEHGACGMERSSLSINPSILQSLWVLLISIISTGFSLDPNISQPKYMEGIFYWMDQFVEA